MEVPFTTTLAPISGSPSVSEVTVPETTFWPLARSVELNKIIVKSSVYKLEFIHLRFENNNGIFIVVHVF